MPRNMSFSLTTEQIRNRTKTVTRRKGWRGLKPGDVVNACVKCMGLKPGEKIEKISQIRIVSVRREQLREISQDDVCSEGFSHLDAEEFVSMFCKHMGGEPDQLVTRIEFEYLKG